MSHTATSPSLLPTPPRPLCPHNPTFPYAYNPASKYTMPNDPTSHDPAAIACSLSPRPLSLTLRRCADVVMPRREPRGAMLCPMATSLWSAAFCFYAVDGSRLSFYF